MNSNKLLEIEKALKQSQNDCELIEEKLAKKLIEISLLTNMLKESLITWIKFMENDYSSVEHILTDFLNKLKNNNQELTKKDIEELDKKQNEIMRSAEQMYSQIHAQEISIRDKLSEDIKINTPLKYDTILESTSSDSSFLNKLDSEEKELNKELNDFKKDKKIRDLEEKNLNELLKELPN